MAGRNRDPLTPYRIFLHTPRGYRYAATQAYEENPETHAVTRRYLYWGRVDEDLNFTPNQRYLNASPEERARLIFPEGWRVDPGAAAARDPLAGVITAQSCGATRALMALAGRCGLMADLITCFGPAARELLSFALGTLAAPGPRGEMGNLFPDLELPTPGPLSWSQLMSLSGAVAAGRGNFFKCRAARAKEAGRQSLALLAQPLPTTRDPLFGGDAQGELLCLTVYALPSRLPVHCLIARRHPQPGMYADPLRSQPARLALRELCDLGWGEAPLAIAGEGCGLGFAEPLISSWPAARPFALWGNVRHPQVLAEIREVSFNALGEPRGMERRPGEAQEYERGFVLETGDDDERGFLEATLRLSLGARSRELAFLRQLLPGAGEDHGEPYDASPSREAMLLGIARQGLLPEGAGLREAAAVAGFECLLCGNGGSAALMEAAAAVAPCPCLPALGPVEDSAFGALSVIALTSSALWEELRRALGEGEDPRVALTGLSRILSLGTGSGEAALIGAGPRQRALLQALGVDLSTAGTMKG